MRIYVQAGRLRRIAWIVTLAWLLFNWGAWEQWWPAPCNYMVIASCEP